MSQNRSLFVVPCYYTGTSFERIYTAIAHVIKECKLPIDIMVGARFDNTLRAVLLMTLDILRHRLTYYRAW